MANRKQKVALRSKAITPIREKPMTKSFIEKIKDKIVSCISPKEKHKNDHRVYVQGTGWVYNMAGIRKPKREVMAEWGKGNTPR